MAKDANTIKKLISIGENHTLQFKREFVGQNPMADEMVPFANNKGDTIVYGLETSEFGLKVEEIANAHGLDPNLYGSRVIEYGLEASECKFGSQVYGLGSSKGGLGQNGSLTHAFMHDKLTIKFNEVSDKGGQKSCMKTDKGGKEKKHRITNLNFNLL